MTSIGSPIGRKAPARTLVALRRSCGGSTMVEFGLMAVPLLMTVFGIIELGNALWLQNALHYSVEEASRCAAVNTTTCSNATQVKAYAAGRSGAHFSTSVFTYNSAAACGKQVTASYPLQLAIPFVSISVTLTSSSCYPT